MRYYHAPVDGAREELTERQHRRLVRGFIGSPRDPIARELAKARKGRVPVGPVEAMARVESIVAEARKA